MPDRPRRKTRGRGGVRCPGPHHHGGAGTAHPPSPLGKIVRSVTKVHAHDEDNTARNGDRVMIMETRPLSKTKRWRLIEVLGRAR